MPRPRRGSRRRPQRRFTRARIAERRIAADRWANVGTAVVAVVWVIGVALMAYHSISTLPKPGSRLAAPPGLAVAAGGSVALPVSLFADGRPHPYRSRTAAGREVRLFVVQGHDGVVRAAFDACVLCFRLRRGCQQEGDRMVCVNCRKSLRSSNDQSIVTGCGPAPLERSADGLRVVLRTRDLDRGAVYF
jgi:uncharacterized membrane protein